ncbi:MAG: UDP-2,3-diacylglucosamine diphosphatase LpxI [Kiritimatiellae bacterium]|nr:UDP-2,3-diacylglucosamine diphosphatase LpxI [Kiritimatiellia bacterium]
MDEVPSVPETLGLIAGRGSYPWLLARSAHAQGVKRVVAFAFKRETDRAIAKHADEVRWLHLGALGALLKAIEESGVRHVVMAGQIKPTRLFSMRFDAKSLSELRKLPVKNAHTIFGAICRCIAETGAVLLPASRFMEKEMPAVGILSAREPTEREWADIRFGCYIAKETSHLELGQTVGLKDGTLLAAEGFEGTDEAILRTGRLGGKGTVIVKVSKPGHDMRFDIPIVGVRTMKMLKKARVSALAVEAGRTILLDKEKVIALADRAGIAFAAVDAAALAAASTKGPTP